MSYKLCGKCKKEKLLIEFYKNKAQKDGFQSKCIECFLAYSKEYSRTKKGKEVKRRSCSKYSKTNQGKVSHNRSSSKWRKENSKKHNCHVAVYRALKKGIIEKTACIECGKKETEAHHEDYSRPLYIKWLCIRCHNEYHRKYENSDLGLPDGPKP